jgi:hypothetical protein
MLMPFAAVTVASCSSVESLPREYMFCRPYDICCSIECSPVVYSGGYKS